MLRKIPGSISNLSKPSAWLSLTTRPEYNVRVRQPTKVHKDFFDEKQAYKKIMREYRMKNIKEYTERQTQVENKYLENWEKLQQETFQRNLVKFRTSVVKISAGTQRHIAEKISNEDYKLSKLKKHMLEEEQKRQNRIRMLKFLNLDSRTWYNLENIESKMKAEVLIPDFVWDQTNYYVKLQEQAIFYQKGDFDGLEEAMNDAEITRIKNARLMPMYAEIVGLVKHLTNNEETQLISEFHKGKNLIEKKNLSKEETKTQINKLREAYTNIINKSLEEGDQT